MGKVMKIAQAGTLESSDVTITVAPGEAGSGVSVNLESIVYAQYGKVIQELIEQILNEQQVTDVQVKAVDRGALDCTIRARMLTALLRSGAIGEALV